jgi:hypothetical protein
MKEKNVQLHPPSEEPLNMMDLCNHTYQMIKGLRWVPEKHWWDKTKDKQVEPRFRNVLQQTFYYNYKYLPMKLYLLARGYKLGSYDVGCGRGC